MSARSAVLAAVWLAAAVVACGHTAPFGPGVYTPNGPLGGGATLRLTYNPGTDLAPAWLPSGGGILFNAPRLAPRDRDRCLAPPPPAGGADEARVRPSRAPAAPPGRRQGGGRAPPG